MNEDTLFDEAVFSEAMRRFFARYGKGAARHYMNIYGAPRRVVARLFATAGLPHGTRRSRRRAHKRR